MFNFMLFSVAPGEASKKFLGKNGIEEFSAAAADERRQV